MMSTDDYYSDPTFFDRWHALLLAAAGRYHRRIQPYLWGLVFHGLALACYLALAIVVADFAVAGAAVTGAAAAHSLAATIAASMALSGGIIFQRAARRAWPMAAGHGKAPATARPARRERRVDPARREQARVFLEALREAGVNVSVARALFCAGIRSTGKLSRTADSELLAIRGVGPATVARLQRHFAVHHVNAVSGTPRPDSRPA